MQRGARHGTDIGPDRRVRGEPPPTDYDLPMPRRPPLHLLRLGLWIGVPVLLWYATKAPFGWIALWIGALLMVGGIRRKQALRFNLAWLFVLLGGAEVLLWAAAPDTGRTIPANAQRMLTAPHDVLGYAPVAGRSMRTRRVIDGRTSFDVVYTIGPNGWRQAPPRSAPAPSESILCFGCSYMFGDGITNEETLSYRLEQALEGRYRVHNIACTGWGPHQMLAALESGLVQETVAQETVTQAPRYVIYLAMADHAGRVAGRRNWDKRGPRYAVRDGGRVERIGSFAELRRESYWERRWRKLRGRSWIRAALEQHVVSAPDPDDVALWVAIVRQARDYVKATWPGAEFHVLLWDAAPEADAAFLSGAKGASLRVHRVSEILPGFEGDWVPWSVDRYDPHPNSKAHAALADYLAREIVGPLKR